MEHVVALAQAPTTTRRSPTDVRAAARLLRDTPAAPPALITIGKPDMRALDAAPTIVEFARDRVAAASRPYVSENGYDTTWLPFDGGNRIPPTTPLMQP